MRVGVCIVTCDRPRELKGVLSSVCGGLFSDSNWLSTVVVVDNGKKVKVRDIVDNFGCVFIVTGKQ